MFQIEKSFMTVHVLCITITRIDRKFAQLTIYKDYFMSIHEKPQQYGTTKLIF